MIQAGNCIVEVPTRHVAERGGKGHELELILTADAEVLVSTVVSVRKGFVSDNVFGALVPGILANNCNCNCNCSDIASAATSLTPASIQPTLAASNCNCNCNCSDVGSDVNHHRTPPLLDGGGSGNCNCNCNCSDVVLASMSPVVLPDRPFRRPFTGGANSAFR